MPFFEIPELIGSLFTAILTPYKAIKDFPNKMIKKFLNFFWNFNKAIDLIWLLDIAHHCFVHFDNNLFTFMDLLSDNFLPQNFL